MDDDGLKREARLCLDCLKAAKQLVRSIIGGDDNTYVVTRVFALDGAHGPVNRSVGFV